jgi:hypothetical protein
MRINVINCCVIEEKQKDSKYGQLYLLPLPWNCKEK